MFTFMRKVELTLQRQPGTRYFAFRFLRHNPSTLSNANQRVSIVESFDQGAIKAVK
jgi:hypothetical protein